MSAMSSTAGKKDRQWLLAITTLTGAAAGQTANALGSDIGQYRAAGATTACAVLTAAVWGLRKVPPRTPLARFVRRLLLTCGFVAAIVAAFGPPGQFPYAASSGCLATVMALLATPGVRPLDLVVRVILVGLGVASVGVFLRAWHDDPGMTALMIARTLLAIFLAYMLLTVVDHVSEILDRAESGRYSSLGQRCRQLGIVVTAIAFLYLFDGEFATAAALAFMGPPMIGLGVSFIKGGRLPVAIAMLGAGTAGVALGVLATTMPDGVLFGLLTIGAGLALVAVGSKRAEVPRRLRLWWRQAITEPPDPRSAADAAVPGVAERLPPGDPGNPLTSTGVPAGTQRRASTRPRR